MQATDGNRCPFLQICEKDSLDKILEIFREEKKKEIVTMVREGTPNFDELGAKIHSLHACESVVQNLQTKREKDKDSLSKFCSSIERKRTKINRENAYALPVVRAYLSAGIYPGVVTSHTKKDFLVSFVVKFKYGTDYAWVNDGSEPENVNQKASCNCGRNKPKHERGCTAKCPCHQAGRLCNKNCICGGEFLGDNVTV